MMCGRRGPYSTAKNSIVDVLNLPESVFSTYDALSTYCCCLDFCPVLRVVGLPGCVPVGQLQLQLRDVDKICAEFHIRRHGQRLNAGFKRCSVPKIRLPAELTLNTTVDMHGVQRELEERHPVQVLWVPLAFMFEALLKSFHSICNPMF